jgi:hypothetical protein
VDLAEERDALKQEVAELRARLEHFEGMFVPGTKLLIPCVAILPIEPIMPGLRYVQTKNGVILKVFPGDAVLDGR